MGIFCRSSHLAPLCLVAILLSTTPAVATPATETCVPGAVFRQLQSYPIKKDCFRQKGPESCSIPSCRVVKLTGDFDANGQPDSVYQIPSFATNGDQKRIETWGAYAVLNGQNAVLRIRPAKPADLAVDSYVRVEPGAQHGLTGRADLILLGEPDVQETFLHDRTSKRFLPFQTIGNAAVVPEKPLSNSENAPDVESHRFVFEPQLGYSYGSAKLGRYSGTMQQFEIGGTTAIRAWRFYFGTDCLVGIPRMSLGGYTFDGSISFRGSLLAGFYMPWVPFRLSAGFNFLDVQNFKDPTSSFFGTIMMSGSGFHVDLSLSILENLALTASYRQATHSTDITDSKVLTKNAELQSSTITFSITVPLYFGAIYYVPTGTLFY